MVITLLIAVCLTTHDPLEEVPVRFNTDVVPLLTKLGCNSGGCHGKATGQNGFKLSLLGFEPELDYLAIAKEGRGRRIFPSIPDRSLLLLKATNRMPHGGGRRLDAGSAEYEVLRKWITQGASPPKDEDPILTRIEVNPGKQVIRFSAKQPLKVTAYFSDGSSRDVTHQAVFESNQSEIASVSEKGLVQTHSKNGLFAVMVRYADKVVTFHGTVPRNSARRAAEQAVLEQLKRKQLSRFDRLLVEQWQRVGILPSNVVNDETFIRRATIDICGTLPTRTEVERFVASHSADKRSQLIEQLLDRPEYASYFAMKWAAILQNRGAGYSTRSQRAGTALFSGWIRDSLAANKRYDQFVTEIITASGSQSENPPAIWYRSIRALPDYVESVAQAFLGVRIQCAQCHHHPFERWSQTDYYGLAAAFARVGRKGGFADAEVNTNEIIFLKQSGAVIHPRTGKVVPPRPPGGPPFKLDRYDDPRHHLARWMTDPANPFFARTLVNRLWAHFLGRGLTDPIDDARSTNPPSNPELLDALSDEFIRSEYDVKHLIKVISSSLAYRLSSLPNDTNEEDAQNFARFYPRRLPAEVLLDGLSQILKVPTQFGGGPGTFPVGTRAIELPDENVASNFLDVFGRPARTSACECERTSAPALGQALELVNSQEIHRKLTAPNGYAAELASNNLGHSENVEDVFLRVFARNVNPAELETAVAFLESEPDRSEAYRSLLWSLVATNEFLFNH